MRSVVIGLSCFVCLGLMGCGVILVILPTVLPNGIVGTFYSQPLTADGQPPLAWQVVSGALPPGLALDASTGTIGGIPTADGTFAFTIAVSERSLFPGTGEQAYSITIIPKLILDATLATGRVNEAYSDTFAVTGGVAPYSFNVIGLPAGVSYDPATGQVSGTPLNAKTVQLQVTVTDSGEPQQSVTKTSFLTVKPPPVSITTTTLANGNVNTLYSEQLATANGTPPYTWQVGPDVGVLPDGLDLNVETGAIAGTPEQAGTWEFTITVTDDDSPATTDSKRFTIVIDPQ